VAFESFGQDRKRICVYPVAPPPPAAA
jgi:hypothetical protein